MAKRFEIQETPSGICSDPNVLKAPQGALKECVNCIIRRDGVVEPKLGANTVSTTGTTLTDIVRMFNFNGSLLLYDAWNYVFEFLSNLGNPLLNEDSGSPEMFPNYYNVQEARGNLYVPCTDGVRKVTSKTSTVLYSTGLRNEALLMVVGVSDDTGYNWLPNTYYVKYRSTLQRKDANGVIIESAPGFPLGYTNSSGFTRRPSVLFVFGDSIMEGDIIKIFRVPMATSASTSGDTYYLAAEHVVTAADISSDTYTYYDRMVDAELGESLYTNSENEGILQGNYIPPVSKCISLYKKSIFYSNTIEPVRVLLRITGGTNDLDGDAYGAGIRILSGDTTIGDKVITNVDDCTGVTVGQLVTGTNIPDNSYVKSVTTGPNTISITNNATGTGAGIVIKVLDTITFGPGGTSGNETYAIALDSITTIKYDAFQIYIYSRNSSTYYFEILDDNGTINNVSIEKRALNSAGFYVWATHGTEADNSYYPSLSPPTWNGSAFVFSTANGLASDMLAKPNRQYWSKSDQPEHVPLVNYHDIGTAASITGTFTIKDGLVVFKDDGIYLVTGEGAYSGWTVRLLDSDNILVHSNAAVAVEDSVYALTNNGLVRVTVYGVEKIGLYYIHQDIEANIQSVLHQRINNNTEIVNCWLIYDKYHNQILFTVPDDYGTGYVEEVYVYNLITKAFTKWLFDGYNFIYYIISHIGNGNSLYYSGNYIYGASGKLWLEEVSQPGGDYRRSRTIASKPDTTTINFTAAHNASVGDQITETNGSYMQEVVSIIDADSLTVADNSDFSGTVYIYTPIESKIRWMPKFGDTRAFRKNFVAYSFMFDKRGNSTNSSLGYYEVQFKYINPTTYGPFAITDKTARGLVPSTLAREQLLEPAIIIRAVNQEWELVGLSLEYYIQAPRGV